MNTATLSGRLRNDPETFAPNGSDYTCLKFSIANNDESKKNQDGEWENVTSWYDIEYWTKKPQEWLQKLKKGVLVVVQCTVKQSRWENDGQTRSRIIFPVMCGTYPIIGASTRTQSTPASSDPFDSSSTDTGFEDNIPF